MNRSPAWILVALTIPLLDLRDFSALAVADLHKNVVANRQIMDAVHPDIFYNPEKLTDGKDKHVGYLYFQRTVTLTLDLARSHTVHYIVIKLMPEAFEELRNVSATVSYSSVPTMPTLKHTFLRDSCVTPKKHENDLYIVYLYRCCGACCSWRLRGIGRFVHLTIEKKTESPSAFGVAELEVHGLQSPDGLNLALFRPILEGMGGMCDRREFVANDAWSDELRVQRQLPPFVWRVDLGRGHELGFVRVVYAGKWGSAKLVLFDDSGTPRVEDTCPAVRSEFHLKNTICCDTRRITAATRWLEIRGTDSLPQLIEVFAYPRSFKLHLSECPIPTTPPPTSSTSSTPSPSTTVRGAPDLQHNRPTLRPDPNRFSFQARPSRSQNLLPAGIALHTFAATLTWGFIR